MESLSATRGVRQRCPPLLVVSSVVLEVLDRASRRESKIKGIHIGKEEAILSVFADDMAPYIENPEFYPKI